MRRKNYQKPTELKSLHEIKLMREAGILVAKALKLCRQMAKPGIRTIEIDQAVEAMFASSNAIPLFKGYAGFDDETPPYPASTCISINEQVVHGIPGNRVLKEGDIVSFDTACKLNGWCADAAITVPVGTVRPERLRLIRIAEETLAIAVREIGRRKYWSEVAKQMEKHSHLAGYSLVENFVGHGIGRSMHEQPQVVNFIPRDRKGLEEFDFRLEPGLVLAIEPMLNMGKVEVEILADHWTVVTKDGYPSAHVEHTVAITENGVEILTLQETEPSNSSTTSQLATNRLG